MTNNSTSVWMVPYCLETGRFLIARRTGDQAGLWNLFGGKVDDGEKPLAAVVREFKEEAGLEVKEKFLVYVGKKTIMRRNNTPGTMRYYMFRSAHEFVPKLNKENDEYAWVGNIPKEQHKSLSTFLAGPHAKMLDRVEDTNKIFKKGKPSERDGEGRFETYTNTGSLRLSYIIDNETAACVDFIQTGGKLVNMYVSPRHRDKACEEKLLQRACKVFKVRELVVATAETNLQFFNEMGFALKGNTVQGKIMEYRK